MPYSLSRGESPGLVSDSMAESRTGALWLSKRKYFAPGTPALEAPDPFPDQVWGTSGDLVPGTEIG